MNTLARKEISRVVVAVLALAACRAPAAPPSEPVEVARDEATETRLRAHVDQLTALAPRCGATPETHQNLEAAARYVQSNLEILLRGATGRSMVVQRFEERGQLYSNVAVEIAGSSPQRGQIVVVGAHYDSDCSAPEPWTPGADDNASGVAAMLELARRFDQRVRAEPDSLGRTLRFVAFTNEEVPYFKTPAMGSLAYAQQAKRKGEDIHAMLALEMLGYFSDEPGSQMYPDSIERLLTLPDRGDFVAILANLGSRSLMYEAVEAFRSGTTLPVEGLAAPYPPQLGWSDNWAFWENGYRAVMVTDTAMSRNPNYHRSGDTAGTLDYRRMAMAVDGVQSIVVALSSTPAL